MKTWNQTQKKCDVSSKRGTQTFCFCFTWGERPVQRPDICFWFYETGVSSVVSLEVPAHPSRNPRRVGCYQIVTTDDTDMVHQSYLILIQKFHHVVMSVPHGRDPGVSCVLTAKVFQGCLLHLPRHCVQIRTNNVFPNVKVDHPNLPLLALRKPNM